MQVKVGGVDTFTIGIKCFVILIKLKKPEMQVFCFQHLEHEMVIWSFYRIYVWYTI